jgi:Pyruvate/2-oxoacid:ferredoxin oxidoreductase gamma subunit
LELTGVVDMKTVEESLKAALPERHHGKIPINMKALERGAELARKHESVK